MKNILGRLHGRNRSESPHAEVTTVGGGFAVLDFETTGLFAEGQDRVVELAVVHVDLNGQIEGEWETLVNPQRDLGKQSIHHVRAADILDAPTFAQVAPQLVELLSGRVLVAHNARFDSSFLDGEFARMGYGPGTPVPVLCTMQLASDIIPGAGRSLADCCKHFDIDLTGAHRAGADAMATAHLLSQYIQATKGDALWATAVTSARAPWVPIPGNRVPWKPRPEEGHVDPHFLERIAVRLPEHSGPEAEQDYLALLDRVLLDRDISAHEADDLVRLAESLELSRTACERIHMAYFRAVVSLVRADNILTDDERNDLQKLAALLCIPDSDLASGLATPPPGADRETDIASTAVAQFALRAGDIVVLTGDMLRPREVWAADLESLGLVWLNYINKKVRLLAAEDPDSLSGKAAKAREYGITIVNQQGLTQLLLTLRETRP